MDFDLTDEQQLIRSTAREFTDSQIIPAARDNAREHRFDLELITKLAKQGYLGAIVPQQYGVRSIPTLLIFKGGKVVAQLVGALPRAKLEAEIQKHIA